jgi:NAD(P)-dependent dehydrogenase (short-subunit alcohol dehydrogenase family)
MSVTSSARAVLVTGASTGIGEACAVELDRRGYRVFAGVRKEADGQRLRAAASANLIPLLIDVTNTAEIATAAETVREMQGATGLAGLVNNAGIAVAGPLEILPLERVRQQLEVNVLGQLAVTQAFLPSLRQARGRIVNMSSFNGRIAAPYLGSYAASKFALEAISDVLRTELRTWGIQVSLVEPQGIATPIWQKSITAADRVAEDLPADGLTLYRADIEAIHRMCDKIQRTAIPVSRVVRAVMHALTARRPRTRYPVGMQTRFAIFAYKRLPDRFWDWLLRRAMGLPRDSR